MKNSQKYYSLASTLLLIFVFLGYVVKFYPASLALENTFQNWLRGNLPTGKTNFFLTITKLGNPPTLIFLTLVFALLFYLYQEKTKSLYVLTNLLLGSGLLNFLMKQAYQRPRPALQHLVTEKSFSFPSGHAMGSMIVFGVFILFLKDSTLTTFKKYVLQSLCLILIFLIGLSRIYLGVHYPSDIVAGWLLGSTWLLATYPLYRRYFFIERFKNPLKQKRGNK